VSAQTTEAPRVATGHRPGGQGSDRQARAIQYGLALVTVLVVLGPILPILYQSVIDRPIYATGQELTTANYRAILSAPAFGGVVWNSLTFSFWSTVISQGLGAVLALLIGRTNLPLARMFGSVTLWPLFISGLVFAFGWFVAYGPSGFVTLWMRTTFGVVPWNLYSISGMSVISGISSIPVTVVFCLGAMALSDSSLEDAARTCGAGPWRVVTRITLPMLLPAIAYSGILNFLGALESLSIPLIIGKPVGIEMFMTFIYAEGIERPQPNYGVVGAATVLLLTIIAVLILLQEKIVGNTRRFQTVSGKATAARIFDLGVWRWPAFALVMAYVLLGIAIPLGMVLLRAFVSFLSPLVPLVNLLTLANFAEALANPSNIRSLKNTLVLAIGGGFLATVAYSLVALVVHRSTFRWRGPLKYIALMPRAVPGVIAGLGVFYAMLTVPGLSALNGTIWIIGLAYLSRYLPTGFGVLSPALAQIGPDLDRAARVMGATWWQATTGIILHLLRPAMLGAYALIFVAFLKEYSTAVFLFGPGTEVLGTSMLRYWVNGDIGPMAALSAVQIGLTVFFIALAQGVFGVRLVK
jgi:iron(III) transport system permease protein